MAEFKPTNPKQHFALQRTAGAAENVSAASEAQQKSSDEGRGTSERFYNSLALFSSGTVALSVTYLGYLKNLPRSIQHPHWLMACWISLMTCAACSLFWPLIYGYYSHYFHEWQTAKSLKEKYEADAKEYPVLVSGALSLQTNRPISQREIDDFVSNRLEASRKCNERAIHAKRREILYRHFWRWLGWAAQMSFLGGLALLLAFATTNF